MNDPEKLKQQMAQIGVRYLSRTLGEMQRMQDLAREALSGSPAMLKDLEQLAHKIHGSGAMFGFDSLSDHAGEIEHLAGFMARRGDDERFKNLSEQDLQQRLRDHVTKLDDVARAAAKERGIESNAQ